jgi:hypothetical protein
MKHKIEINEDIQKELDKKIKLLGIVFFIVGLIGIIMYITIGTIMETEIKIIKANEGKVFRRIADGQIYGKEISLGYSYYIDGVRLTEPHLDIPEDFEQIDEPVREERTRGGDR